MTSDASASAPETKTRSRDEILAAAVAVLTEAARLTWSHTDDDGAITTHRADWAEFVTQVLAGVAANVGGIEPALAGRPGSWEADHVRNLLASTVGHDEEYLLEYRTEPLVVKLCVDQILCDLGAWKAYDDAQQELYRRYVAIGIPTATTPEADVVLTPATDEQERQCDELADLEERLEQQRERDWAAYGQALKANVEAAAASLPGLQVPVVVVTVDLDTWCVPDGDCWVADRLRAQAIRATPAPAGPAHATTS